MNTSNPKAASSNSSLANVVFVIINILLFPITLIGYVLYVGYLYLFGRTPGVSMTAQGRFLHAGLNIFSASGKMRQPAG